MIVGTPSRPGSSRFESTFASRSRTSETCVVAALRWTFATTWAPPATAMPGSPWSTTGAGPAAVAAAASAKPATATAAKRVFMR